MKYLDKTRNLVLIAYKRNHYLEITQSAILQILGQSASETSCMFAKHLKY